MGYLDNTTITVDAILTKKGRQKLSSGQALGITKFALGDDEIDYSLYRTDHPLGSAFYDALIKATPITEASPDESQALRYKLVTLPKGTTRIPIVSLGITSISVYQDQGEVAISPTTSPAGNTNSGYTLVLADQRAGTLSVSHQTARAITTPTFLPDQITSTAHVVAGLKFSFTPNRSITSDIETTLTAYGNDTGGSVSVPVIVKRRELQTTQ